MTDDATARRKRLISYNSLHRARHTVEDFVQMYMPLQGLDVRSFLRWWDLLVFVEGVIYELDEMNEQLSREGILQPPANYMETFEALQDVLEEEGMLTDALKSELKAGLDYWQGERKLARLMLEHPVIPDAGQAIFGLDEVQTVAAGKSFDYRVLNLLVYTLRKEEPPLALLEFLRVDERLVDTSDDLVDYEDDVERNAFNLLRCFTHLFGRDAPLKLAAFISECEARHASLLAQLPDEWRQHYSARQKDAAESDAALRWVIPPLILDEAAFRAEHASD